MARKNNDGGYRLNYYSYSGRRAKNHNGTARGVFIRLAVVIVSLAVVFLLTAALGNHLKNKIDRGELPSGVNVTVETAPAIELDDISITVSDLERMRNGDKFHAAFMDFNDYTTVDGLAEAFSEISAASYTAVTLPLTDKNGTLAYESSAPSRLTRASDAGIRTGNAARSGVDMRAVFTAAETMNLYTIGLWNVDPTLFFSSDEDAAASRRIDALYIGELSVLGLDELLIYGADEPGGVTRDAVCESIVGYIEQIRSVDRNIKITLALSPSYYFDASSAPYVERLAAAVDYLAIDIPGAIMNSESVYDDVTAITGPLEGSFSLYNLRALLDGSDSSKLREQLDAVAYCGVENWQIITKNAAQTNDADNSQNDAAVTSADE